MSVLIVNVDVAALVPSSVTDAGLKLHEAFFGRPEHVKLTCWLKPPDGVMVTVDVTELPPLTVPLVGFNAMLKSPEVTAVTTMLIAEEVEAALLLSPA